MGRRPAIFTLLAASEASKPSPVGEVVQLLSEMQETVQAEGQKAEKVWEDYHCWCEAGIASKADAIEDGQVRLDDLKAFVRTAGGDMAELTVEIDVLGENMAKDSEAVSTAMKLRNEELAEFMSDEKDMKETIAALTNAVEVLSKVQLVQRDSHHAMASALMQVKTTVRSHWSQFQRFQGVMQRDLFDMLSSWKDSGDSIAHAGVTVGALLGEAFLTRKEATVLEQAQAEASQPSNIKAYDAQSGQIFGVLRAMRDKFSADLGDAQRQEFRSEETFQKLRAAKTAEILSATESKNRKQARYAELEDEVAKAKDNIQVTADTLDSDRVFLGDLKKTCMTAAKEWEVQKETRAQELLALAEVTTLLTEDDARESFQSSLSFLQVSRSTQREQSKMMVQESLKRRIMTRLASTARKTGSMSLASLAVKVELDDFTRLKKSMEHMISELKQQQTEEADKHDECKKHLGEAEDDLKDANRKKQDLGDENLQLSNTMETIKASITKLKDDVKEMEFELNRAGINRKEENTIYQRNVADQRAAAQILTIALNRLAEFYAVPVPKIESTAAALTQIKVHSTQPDKPEYTKNSSGGSVMQLLAKIISEIEIGETEDVASESHAQEAYSEFVRDTAASINSDRQSIAEKSKQLAEVESQLSETRGAQLSNNLAVENLHGVLLGVHKECDYLLEYFDTRQKARAEEIDSIDQAKAILAGAGN